MKKFAILGAVALAGLSGVASADVLYDNGPVVNSNGRSVVFARDSIYGYGESGGQMIADDFQVTGQGWDISSIDLFSYQTGAGSNNFTFTNVSWEVLSNDMSTVVASGTAAPTDAGFVGYRTILRSLNNTDRAIYDLSVDTSGLSLSSGHYWLAWSVTGSSQFSGPWQPALSDHSTGNAMQFNGTDWVPITARQNAFGQYFGNPQDVPFVINGAVAAVPEPSTLLSLAAGLGLLGVMRRRRNT